MRVWCSGNMRAFQALVTGSIPVTRSEPSGSYSPIAQLAEYLTVNQSVPGSSPGGGVIGINNKSYTDNNGKNRNTNLC